MQRPYVSAVCIGRLYPPYASAVCIGRVHRTYVQRTCASDVCSARGPGVGRSLAASTACALQLRPDNPPMHLLIPFAGVLSEAGRQAAAHLVLPQLQGLLQCLAPPQPQDRDDGDVWSLSPPHERALAKALGWQGADGCLPWAAQQAAADGITTARLAWGLVTPVHWHVGTDQVSLIDPEQLLLDETTSRALFAALHELFSGVGIALHYGTASRWYAAHEMLAEMPCASLDRVIGRNVDRWLGVAAGSAAAAQVRRLQAEVQMLLYTHPLNDARQARGLLPVNSFWLSGCGRAQPALAVAAAAAAAASAVHVEQRLRSPALAENWPGWVQAWQTLDDGPLADLHRAARAGEPVQITLCGERAAQTLRSGSRGSQGWLQRLRRRLSSPAVQPLLEQL